MLCLACVAAARILLSDTRSSSPRSLSSIPVGYNPINGEAYSGGKNADSAPPTQVVAEPTVEHKDNSQAAGDDSKQNSNVDQAANGNNAQKVRLNSVEWSEDE